MVTTFQEFQDDGITPTEMLKQRQDGHSFLRARTDWGGSRTQVVDGGCAAARHNTARVRWGLWQTARRQPHREYAPSPEGRTQTTPSF